MPPTIRRSHDLRSENRRRVVEALRSIGPCSREALGEATSLSPAAISSFASELIAEGVVNATRTSTGRGRPRSELALSPTAATMITVSLTIDRLELQLIDYAGIVLRETCHDLETRTLARDEFITAVLSAIDELAQSPCAQRLRQISVSCQGITTHPGGELVWSPVLSVNDVPLRASISERFKIETSVDNDGRLIAGALHTDEQDRLGSNFATMIFSNGIGLALILNDQPFSGIATSALELGHLPYIRGGELCRCGQHGCIEAYAADYAIIRSIERQRPSSNTTARKQTARLETTGRIPEGVLASAAKAAAAGDELATSAFAEAGSAIGFGLRDLFLLFGPMPVALVGRNAEALQAMHPQLLAALEVTGPQASDLASVPLEVFPDESALLHRGLICNALAEVDRQLAEITPPSSQAPITSARLT